MNEKELKEEFFKEFNYIQTIKNEESGNSYKKIADWWLSKLKSQREEILGELIQEVEFKIHWIDGDEILSEKTLARNEGLRDAVAIISSLRDK